MSIHHLRPAVGVSRVEHALNEAVLSFRRAEVHEQTGHRNAATTARREGIGNLAHALHIALTDREQIPPDVSREMFQRVTAAARCFEPEANGA